MKNSQLHKYIVIFINF